MAKRPTTRRTHPARRARSPIDPSAPIGVDAAAWGGDRTPIGEWLSGPNVESGADVVRMLERTELALAAAADLLEAADPGAHSSLVTFAREVVHDCEKVAGRAVSALRTGACAKPGVFDESGQRTLAAQALVTFLEAPDEEGTGRFDTLEAIRFCAAIARPAVDQAAALEARP